jgi:uncharacterized membrane protein
LSREQFRNWWENVQSSLWFIPAVLGIVAIALSFIMPEIDSRVEDELTRHTDWLFFGTADSARAILSAISGSLITVITLLFSITMLTLQQAATQYTPRIIRTFMNDRGIQSVLGVFLATFLYSLLVLRQVRGEDAIGGSSIPMLSVSLAILLTLACLALLIFFIHHSATMFQAATIVERIHHEMLDSIDRLYPEAIGEGVDDAPSLDAFRTRYARQPGVLVRSDGSGYLRRIDDGAILDAIDDGGWGIVMPPIGVYVTHQTPLVELGAGDDTDDNRIAQVRSAFILDKERTLSQDDMFGVRQLVDIALKALSPSIHDPTTAEHVISCLGDILTVLAGRSFPSATRSVEPDEVGKRVVLWVNRPDFDAYVDASFSQIRRVARDNVHVTYHLLNVLTDLERATSGDRALAVRREIDRVLHQTSESNFDAVDQSRMRALAGVRQ